MFRQRLEWMLTGGDYWIASGVRNLMVDRALAWPTGFSCEEAERGGNSANSKPYRLGRVGVKAD
ncbi:hypothetical protein [Streptomyces sp. NBC_00019]|uniref:hypothetical protein n=1 Tax=Streptomyces sp. NBC_00019 TaxID=2975623 RepID=UPI003255210D